jgi:hypothetical protein
MMIEILVRSEVLMFSVEARLILAPAPRAPVTLGSRFGDWQVT